MTTKINIALYLTRILAAVSLSWTIRLRDRFQQGDGLLRGIARSRAVAMIVPFILVP